jgi:hypothetical protein
MSLAPTQMSGKLFAQHRFTSLILSQNDDN